MVVALQQRTLPPHQTTTTATTAAAAAATVERVVRTQDGIKPHVVPGRMLLAARNTQHHTTHFHQKRVAVGRTEEFGDNCVSLYQAYLVFSRTGPQYHTPPHTTPPPPPTYLCPSAYTMYL